MDTWDYESEATPDYEEDFGPLYAKYQREIGRSVSCKAPNGERYHGTVAWVVKTGVKSSRERRWIWYPQYVVLDDQGKTRMTTEVMFDA